MKRLLLPLLLLLTALPVLQAQTRLSITSGGKSREMLIDVPSSLGKDRPLLISLHGMNQDMNYQRNQANYKAVADTAKFLVVYPQGEGNSWDLGGTKDINFILDIIEEMATRYSIDKGRVYLSGFSMGGMMTYYAMTKIADKIAAFAPVSGYNMGGPNANSSRPIPILHVHGTSDDVCVYDPVPNHISAWVKRNKCSTTPQTIKPKSGPSNTAAELIRYRNGENGVEVAHLKLPGKGHWHSNDGNSAMTNIEVWNFCRRWSIDGLKVLRKVSPEDGSFDMLSERDRTYTVTFTQYMTQSGMEAVLTNAKGTEVARMKPNEDRKTLKLTFTLPDEVVLEPGTYTLSLSKLLTLDGASCQNIKATYTYGVEEVGEQMNVDTLLCQDWYGMKEELGEGIPVGWIRTNKGTIGTSEKRGGITVTDGCRMLYFQPGGDFDAGFYLSARDYDYATLVYGRIAGDRMTLRKNNDYLLSFNATYWNESARKDKSTFSVTVEKTDATSPTTVSGLLPTGCLKENTDQTVSASQHFEIPFSCTSSGYYQVTFRMEAGWNGIVLSTPLITTAPTQADRYKGTFLRTLSQARRALQTLQQGDMTGYEQQAEALAAAIQQYQDFTSISPTEYTQATQALQAALTPVLAVGIETLRPASSPTPSVWYDLTGRRIQQPRQGLYIKDGRKVLINM